jgi:phosphopantetheine adenylyltransferase
MTTRKELDAHQIIDRYTLTGCMTADDWNVYAAACKVLGLVTLKERQERVHFVRYQGLMVDAIKAWDMGHKDKVTAVVRGLRNGQDLESERVQQYWNEDLGLTVPTMFILSSRELVHISSSAIRNVQKFQ